MKSGAIQTASRWPPFLESCLNLLRGSLRLPRL